MSDDPLYYVCDAGLATQLVLPAAFGLLFFTSKRLQALADKDARKERKHRKQRRKQRPIEGTEKKKAALVPLRCKSCNAPVPLEGEVFRCRHCDAEVKPPPEYVAALKDRRDADVALERAERVWRFSRFTSSPFVTVALRAAMIGWFLFVLFCAAGAREAWPSMIRLLAIVLAFFFALWGYFLGQSFAELRAKLPPLPRRALMKCEAGGGDCRECGAPIRFAEDRLTTLCPYCGGQNYRAAIAQADRKTASKQKAAAERSIVDAVADRDDRRAEILLMIPFMAIAEIFYVVVFTVVAIGDMLGC